MADMVAVQLVSVEQVALSRTNAVVTGNVADARVTGRSFGATYNVKATNTRNTRKAISNARRNTGTGSIFAFVGDSTVRGSALSRSAAAWPDRMAQSLSALGVPAQADSHFGWINGLSIAQMQIFDPRLSIGAGWEALAAQWLGGLFIRNFTTTNPFTFTPTGRFDTVEVYVKGSSGGGIMTLDIDGATSGAAFKAVDTKAASTVLQKYTLIAPTVGIHTVNYRRASGGPVTPVGAAAYDSTKSAIRVLNTAFGGATTANWVPDDAGAITGPAGAVQLIKPNVVFVSLAINDLNGKVPIATVSANLQAIITRFKGLGADVWLVDENETNGAPGAQADARAATRALALSNDLPMISQYDQAGPYETVNARGWMKDTTHPNEDYNDDLGRFIASVIFACRTAN